MGLTAHTKHALRLSLGHQAGGEMINAIDGFADTLAALTAPAEDATDQPAADPVADPAPAGPVVVPPAPVVVAVALPAPVVAAVAPAPAAPVTPVAPVAPATAAPVAATA